VSGAASPGQVVILNGAPRSGKSSIATAIQQSFSGTWVNLGVDVARAMTPSELQPGIGLRPGEAAHPAASSVPLLYAALWESVAAHARLGLNVVVDVGLYDTAVAADAAHRLEGLAVLFVGVRCDVETIMQRRRSAPEYVSAIEGDPVPEAVRLWQHEVHARWTYDLDVDTSAQTPEQCAAAICRRLVEPPLPDSFAQIRLPLERPQRASRPVKSPQAP
jgi:chloramphenicol 3-O phosphotransferase